LRTFGEKLKVLIIFIQFILFNHLGGRKKMLEKVFKLKENNTTVKTEIIAGFTTFMTMAYIIALNPNLLTGFGANGGQSLWNAVFLATCIASAIGIFCMAFMANKPFAMAPGMGLNSFFALVVTNIVGMTGFSYVKSFQTALCIVFIEGVLFIILSVLNVREKIVDAIPLGVRLGIAPAIGMMLLNIGLGSNAGIYSEKGGPFYVMRDFFGALTPKVAKDSMGSGYSQMVLTVVTMFIGLFIIIILAKKNIKASVILGMLAASIIYWAGEAIFLKTNPFAGIKASGFIPPFSDLGSQTLFKLNFSGLAEIGWFTAVTLIITFCIIDMFDTIGTLVGTASRAGMVDENGKMPNMKQALLADAIGTVTGSVTGTSTVTTFVESASGVEAGGRTGLTAFTTGILFLACIFIAPIAAVIPAAATSSALIYVGILMLSGLKNIKFDDIDQVVPVAIMLIAMPISGSIGHAIGLGLISYTVIKLFTGKGKEVSMLTYVLSIIFLIKFFLAV
jgi:AGZA family xanthine/uracil permease-like MFS transporter